MPKKTSYAQGTPNWVDLQTTDPEAAKAFYSGLFDWHFDDMPAGEGSVYSMVVKDGEYVTAVSGLSPEAVAQGQPATWNTYIAVDDVDAATEAARAAGGQVFMGPLEVMEAGRMSIVADPTGAVFSLWQAKQHKGATLVNEPGTLIWNELLTDDGEAAYPFYGKVLGVSTEETDMGSGPYTVFKVGDAMVGGSMAPPMEGIPNHWLTYFAVADLEETLDKARKLGGKVLSGPNPTPIGPMATVSDPQGAVFSLFESASPSE